jgi:hypothetical protein
VKGTKLGEVVAASGGTVTVHGQGGFIVVHRLRHADGKKIAADEGGLPVGAILGA